MDGINISGIWLDGISTRIRDEYKLRKGGPPIFKLKCCTIKG